MDRDEYIEVDYDAIRQVEEEDNLKTGYYRNQFMKCNLTKTGKKFGCKKIGHYDGNSILHYKNIFGDQSPRTIFTTKKCINGECDYGQRRELSPGDVRDIEDLYKCGMNVEGTKNDLLVNLVIGILLIVT